MADYTTIDDPSEYFQTKIWTGNATSRTIDLDSNSTMQPDFSWVKTRSETHTHYLQDSTSGTTKYLRSQMSAAQQTSSGPITYNSTGFGVGSGDEPNTDGATVVGWFWKANGGTRTTFTESGANPGGGYQVNTTAGFSIVDYTGTGSAGTVSHGLTAKPEFIIVKRLDGTADWNIYHAANTSEPETEYLRFTTANTSDVTTWNDTAPTTSVFSVSDDSAVNGNDNTYIAFCWASKQGYSKFGKYEGTGHASGPFIYTGFKPALILIKNIDNSGWNWAAIDNARTPFNGEGVAEWLWPDLNNAEFTDTDSGIDMDLDMLSNGFKITTERDELNLGSTFVYMAFAEQPFVTSTDTNSIPATAK